MRHPYGIGSESLIIHQTQGSDVMHLYDEALELMESTVHDFARRVPAPQAVAFRDAFVFRYIEKTLHQAIVQKLARLVSSLHATRLLMEAGHVQEQGVLQRTLDEISEDVTFLAYSVISNEKTDLHQSYLNAFFQEEFDPAASTSFSGDRPTISRKKIRAYLDRINSGPKGSSKNLDASRTVSKAYSGYVHAASPHIMDMYGGGLAKFYLRGMKGTPRHAEHRADLWNCFCRAIIVFAFSAKAFGDDSLFNSIREYSNNFCLTTGVNFQSNEWDDVLRP